MRAILIACFLLFAGCSASQPSAPANTLTSEIRYATSLLQISIDIYDSGESARDICVAHAEIWLNETLLRKGWSEPQRSAYVESAVKLSVSRNQTKIDQLVTKKNSLRDAIRGLPYPPPERLKPAYEKLLQLYSQYAVFVALAQSPRGGVVSYNDEINAAVKAFNLVYDEFRVLIPSY